VFKLLYKYTALFFLTVLKFGDFVFNSTRMQLEHKGQCVPLRPKALQLLSLLVENRVRIVTKDEILLSLWGSNYAPDHLLFQLVSELRKAPFSSDFIRTQPNLGYQWNVSTEVVSPTFLPRMKVAAVMIMSVLCVPAWLLFNSPDHSRLSSQLPAQNAFTKGIIAMDRGRVGEAVKWFKFALKENPESVESSLFLAEALLYQNKVDESLAHTQVLLQQPQLSEYDKMTATNLLSRIRQRQGRLYEALELAHNSSQAKVIAQCSVDAVDRRAEVLAGKLGIPLVTSKTALVEPELSVEVDQNYVDNCKELLPNLEETSYCVPENFENLYVSFTRNSILNLG